MNRFLSICFAAIFSTAQAAEPWTRHTIDDSSRGADGVRLADVNGDRLPDIATGWEEGGKIRVYLNPGPKGAKQSWPAVTVGTVKSPEDAVFADLDGDGATDVVSSCEGRNRTMFVHWAPKEPSQYLNAAAWETAAIPCTERKQSWMFALPMQIDGHGGIDLVVGSKGGNASIGWLESPQDARDLTSWKLHPLYKASWIMSLQARDMDADGDLDVLASDRKGGNRGVVWLENPGPTAAKSGAKWQEHRIGPKDREVMFLTIADVDNDQRDDIVCAVKGRGITWYRATGKPANSWQLREIPLPAGYGTGKGVAVADLNLDQQVDIVFSCENAKGELAGVGWLSADSGDQKTWNPHPISGSTGVKFDRIELIDMDHDGDPDVLTCEERDNLGVIWYENPTRR